MRRLFIAFFGMLGLFACGTPAFAKNPVPVPAINALKNEVLTDNHLTETKARHLPIGFVYTIKGTSHVITSDSPYVWSGCQEFLEQTSPVSSPAQPAPIAREAPPTVKTVPNTPAVPAQPAQTVTQAPTTLKEAPKTFVPPAAALPSRISTDQPVQSSAAKEESSGSGFKAAQLISWFIGGLVHEQFASFEPFLRWSVIVILSALVGYGLCARLSRSLPAFLERRRTAQEAREAQYAKGRQVSKRFSTPIGPAFSEPHFGPGEYANEDGGPLEFDTPEPVAVVYAGPMPPHMRTPNVRVAPPRLTTQPRMNIRQPPVRPRRN
jgi:hypothetical protein